jgi:hypothetical protein
MRICAAREKIGCSGGKILCRTREANVLKFTNIYDNDSSKFCELGERPKEYSKKTTEIA